MTANLGTLSADVAARLGAALDPTASAHIALWLARLGEWNARTNLTAARSPEELVDLMLADALVLAPHMPPGATLVDIGAGAGAPGLALALVRRDLRVTLVEPLGKRASFLRTVIGAVGRPDIAIERARGEALSPQPPWDVAVSRATLPPEAWLDLGTRLVVPGGTIWVLVAGESAPTHPRAALELDQAYVWPLTGAPRRLLRYRSFC
ncbi:MAG TPA: RsmG family class I SAM-dependent methyltransferase [Polyangiaceae bacterium]|nr:RsmG family class I SAM-dependent methyltransferase [Polyangiaceae bacterium]